MTTGIGRRVFTFGALSLGIYGSVGQAAHAADACSLLTDAEVSSVMAMEVEPGHRPVVEDGSLCVWRQKNRPQGVASNVLLTVLTAEQFERDRSIRGRPGQQRPLEPGLGDGSYFHSALGLPVLSVKKGDHYFQVMARKLATEQLSDPQEIEQAEKKAETDLASAILKHT
jgi:hypothetical protein